MTKEIKAIYKVAFDKSWDIYQSNDIIYLKRKNDNNDLYVLRYKVILNDRQFECFRDE